MFLQSLQFYYCLCIKKRWIIFSSPEDRGITESDGRDLETLINLEDAQERYDEHKILMAAKRAETLAHQFNSNPVKMQRDWKCSDYPIIAWFLLKLRNHCLSSISIDSCNKIFYTRTLK